MNFSNFRFEIEKAINNASSGIFEAYINGEGVAIFEFDSEWLKITYFKHEWSYSYRGCIGIGDTLLDAINDEEKKYNKAYNLYMAQFA